MKRKFQNFQIAILLVTSLLLLLPAASAATRTGTADGVQPDAQEACIVSTPNPVATETCPAVGIGGGGNYGVCVTEVVRAQGQSVVARVCPLWQSGGLGPSGCTGVGAEITVNGGDPYDALFCIQDLICCDQDAVVEASAERKATGWTHMSQDGCVISTPGPLETWTCVDIGVGGGNLGLCAMEVVRVANQLLVVYVCPVWHAGQPPAGCTYTGILVNLNGGVFDALFCIQDIFCCDKVQSAEGFRWEASDRRTR